MKTIFLRSSTFVVPRSFHGHKSRCHYCSMIAFDIIASDKLSFGGYFTPSALCEAGKTRRFFWHRARCKWSIPDHTAEAKYIVFSVALGRTALQGNMGKNYRCAATYNLHISPFPHVDACYCCCALKTKHPKTQTYTKTHPPSIFSSGCASWWQRRSRPPNKQERTVASTSKHQQLGKQRRRYSLTPSPHDRL